MRRHSEVVYDRAVATIILYIEATYGLVADRYANDIIMFIETEHK